MTLREAPAAGAIDPPPPASVRPHAAYLAWRMRRAAVVAAWSLFGSGCSLVPPAPADSTSLHLLDARPAVATTARRDYVLAVSPTRAAPGFDSAGMAYVDKEHALDRFATHRWADTPARMLGPLLTRTLEDAGSFRAVVSASSALPADLRLDTEIVLLRQNFLARPSRVEFTLRAQLIDGPGRRVLATRYIEAAREAPSDDAPGGVVAANAAVASALAQVAAFCVEEAAGMRARATSAQGVPGPAPR